MSYPPTLSQRRTELSFICPEGYPKGSICLPTVIERAVLGQRHTWHFSTQGLPCYYITVITRRLLPYVFTLACRSFSEGWFALTINSAWRLFSVALSVAPPDAGHPALHRYVALCCPDFPPRQNRRGDSLVCSKYKSMLIASSIRIGSSLLLCIVSFHIYERKQYKTSILSIQQP